MKLLLKIVIILLLLLIAIISGLWLFDSRETAATMIYGVSFSDVYAEYLHLKPREVYTAVLDEWKFRHIRINAQWDRLEEQSGVYDFSELDWQMDEAAKRGVGVMIAMGQKTPRWPECHLPWWTAQLTTINYEIALNRYLSTVVNRYKNHPALEIWQVENEPFLMFGVSCTNFQPRLLDAEIALVKKIDSIHKTLVSDSGELSSWFNTIRAADLFGTTLYRVVWNKSVGYVSYNWVPAIFYRLKFRVLGRDITTAYVTELQAEPWIPSGLYLGDVPLNEQYKSLSLNQLRKNTSFVKHLGVPRAYLWGAEWWYWLRKRGQSEIPEFIKTLRKE